MELHAVKETDSPKVEPDFQSKLRDFENTLKAAIPLTEPATNLIQTDVTSDLQMGPINLSKKDSLVYRVAESQQGHPQTSCIVLTSTCSTWIHGLWHMKITLTGLPSIESYVIINTVGRIEELKGACCSEKRWLTMSIIYFDIRELRVCWDVKSE